MKIVSRALRVALAGGMVAGAFAVAQPSESDAAVTTVAICTGTRGIATAKSTFIWPGDGKAAGVTDKDHDYTVSTKGIHATGGTVGTVGGACVFTQSVAFEKGLTKTPADTKTLLKWGSKVVTPTGDCVPEAIPDTDEWPASGKLSYAWDDLQKTDAYVTFASPTGTPSDVVVLAGIVTKGTGVGAQINAGISYTPAIKDKLVTVDYDAAGQPTLLGEVLAHYLATSFDYAPAGPGAEDHIPTANDIALYQGVKADNALTVAAGCQATVEPGVETANLRSIYIQGGPSPLLGSTVPTTTMTIGAA